MNAMVFRLWSYLFLLIAGFGILVTPLHLGAEEPLHDELKISPRAGSEFEAAELNEIVSNIGQLNPLQSLLVSQNGSVVLEYYSAGNSAKNPVNIKSASKSIISALIGIALDQGHLRSIEQTVDEFFPRFLSEAPPAKQDITIRDLLLMRSGLESTSFGNYGPWVNSRHWLRNALRRPLVNPPGKVTNYSTGNSHILAGILTKATGQDLKDYAQQHLFEPLGVNLKAWQRSPEGYRFGGNNLSLTPRGMLRFGQLYLNSGRWNGKQIIPADWVRRSTASYVHDTYHGFPYGYFWWNVNYGTYHINFAWGHGGQYIFYAPELNLVVITTSDLQSKPGTNGYTEKVHELVREKIVPSAAPSFDKYFWKWNGFR